MRKIRFATLLSSRRPHNPLPMPDSSPTTADGTAVSTDKVKEIVNKQDLMNIADDAIAHQLIATVIETIESRQQAKSEWLKTRQELSLAHKKIAQMAKEKREVEADLALQAKQLLKAHEEITALTLKNEQLAEDYQGLKMHADKKIHSLKSELNDASASHKKMMEDLGEVASQKDSRIFSLEAKIKEQELKYQKLLEEFEELQRDHQRLIDRVSGFAKQSLTELIPVDNDKTAPIPITSASPQTHRN